jgi:hypothetical protein
MSLWRWRLWVQAPAPPIEFQAVQQKSKPLPSRYRPSLDPVYLRLRVRPPRQAFSTQIVRCWNCRNEHAWWERKHWSGSQSFCPCCNSDITSFADESIELRERNYR